jgi:glycosyltransferase involved in cell wall biosynthesis
MIMNVKTLSPRPWAMTRGGVEVQIKKTTTFLNQIDVNASYLNFYDDSLDFDLLHLFSSDYVFNDLAKLTKGVGKKLVVSSVYYTEYPNLLSIWMATINKLTWRSYFDMKRNVMAYADIVLPNCHAELNQMNKIFSIPLHKMRVIPNGVDAEFETCDGRLFESTYGWKDFVLCVSRLDSRKNIDKLIEAVLQTDLRLVLIGMIDHNKSHYGYKIKKMIDANPNQIMYIGVLPHDSPMLKSAYGACAVHALPSKLETPGLCNLEAGLAGKKIVVSDLPTIREYLNDYAYYCIPNSVNSIKKSLLRAVSSTNSNSLQVHIKNNFLWNTVAQKTKDAYLSILN